MEKTEAVSRLKKAGYQVRFDSSVVTVLLSPKVNAGQELKKLRAFLQEIGYSASFGIRQEKEKAEEPEDKLPEKQEEGMGLPQVEVVKQFSLEDYGIG